MEDEFNDWRVKGPCSTLTHEEYDTLFFPEAGRSINKAKEFCKDCPVIEMCLEYAIKTDSDGIWAGTCKRDRDRMSNALSLRQSRARWSPVVVKDGRARVRPHYRSKKVKRTNFVFS